MQVRSCVRSGYSWWCRRNGNSSGSVLQFHSIILAFRGPRSSSLWRDRPVGAAVSRGHRPSVCRAASLASTRRCRIGWSRRHSHRGRRLTFDARLSNSNPLPSRRKDCLCGPKTWGRTAARLRATSMACLLCRPGNFELILARTARGLHDSASSHVFTLPASVSRPAARPPPRYVRTRPGQSHPNIPGTDRPGKSLIGYRRARTFPLPTRRHPAPCFPGSSITRGRSACGQLYSSALGSFCPVSRIEGVPATRVACPAGRTGAEP